MLYERNQKDYNRVDSHDDAFYNHSSSRMQKIYEFSSVRCVIFLIDFISIPAQFAQEDNCRSLFIGPPKVILLFIMARKTIDVEITLIA